MKRLKTAVLISGRGTNMQALIDECASPEAPAEIALIVSNVPGAPGLDRAIAADIPTLTIDHRDFPDRESFEERLTQDLTVEGIELICLAGFMRLLTKRFVEHWRDRLINIHPALLPSFKGLHTHQRALEAGVRIAGCTVHYVRADVDVGPIIAQAAVPVLPGDNEDNLAARVLKQEHRLYPLAVELIARGLVHVENGRVRIEEADSRAEDAVLINPPPFG